jgi:hypothetical protein
MAGLGFCQYRPVKAQLGRKGVLATESGRYPRPDLAIVAALSQRNGSERITPSHKVVGAEMACIGRALPTHLLIMCRGS